MRCHREFSILSCQIVKVIEAINLSSYQVVKLSRLSKVIKLSDHQSYQVIETVKLSSYQVVKLSSRQSYQNCQGFQRLSELSNCQNFQVVKTVKIFKVERK